jgi:hypothetical protein
MPLFLYDWPNWALGLLFTIGWALLGVSGHALLHRLRPVELAEADRNLAIALLAVVATVNSLLLAFAAIAVWQSYSDANQATTAEATAMSQLSRDLAVFDTAPSDLARQRLKDYARVVVDKEWPAMRIDQLDEGTWQEFDELFRAVGQLQPATPREVALMPQIWSHANELVKFRRDRLDAVQDQVPVTLWAVIILGTVLTILPTYALPRTRFNQALVAMLSFSMGLMFFFIAAMDRPFAGQESIGPEPFESVLRNMALWDTEKPR